MKKTMGLDEEYTAFDADILLYINAVFADLKQIGVGPTNIFTVADKNATWASFIPPNNEQGNVPAYVSLRVRLLFDPPESPRAIESIEKQIEALEWRISERREVMVQP